MAYHEYDHNWQEIVRTAVDANGFTVEAMIRFDPEGRDGHLGTVLAHRAWTGKHAGGGEYVVWGFNLESGGVFCGEYSPYGVESEREAARQHALREFARWGKLPQEALGTHCLPTCHECGSDSLDRDGDCLSCGAAYDDPREESV